MLEIVDVTKEALPSRSGPRPNDVTPPKLYKIEDCDQLSIHEVHALYRRHVNSTRVDLLRSFSFGHELAESARGAWIQLKNGRRILDFTGGIGVLNHGHNHPRILKARRRFQELERVEVHRNYFSPYIAALSHNVAVLLPGDLQYCFFPNSGSEAVEGALKTAFKYHGGQRDRFLYSDIACHGKLLGAGSVTNSPENHFPFPRIPNTEMFRFNDIDSVHAAVERTRDARGRSTIAGIIVEPFNAGNLRASSPEFLRALRALCDREDIILIFDEVYSGWGKTGELFNFMRVPGLVPDVLCMAKSLGGGKASISGIATRKHVFERSFDDMSSANLQTTTFYAFGEETITALEAINIIVDENLVGRARAIETRLGAGLRRLQAKYPGAIRALGGAGAFHGVFFHTGPQFLASLVGVLPGELFRDKRFLAKLVTSAVVEELYADQNVLSFMSMGEDIHLLASPPLVASDAEIDIFLAALDEVLAKGLLNLVFQFTKKKFRK